MSEDNNAVEPVERYLVYKCCLCGKEYGRKPLPPEYGKELPAKYQTGDLTSHGFCDAHASGIADAE